MLFYELTSQPMLMLESTWSMLEDFRERKIRHSILLSRIKHKKSIVVLLPTKNADYFTFILLDDAKAITGRR